MNDQLTFAAVIEALRAHMLPDAVVDDDCGPMLLVDLGIDSMRLISIVMALEAEIGLDLELVADATTPQTVSDLVQLVARSCPYADGEPVTSGQRDAT